MRRAEPTSRLDVLCDGLQVALDTEWAVALTGDPAERCRLSVGSLPEEGWLVAFLAGARFMPSTEPAPGDVAWATCR